MQRDLVERAREGDADAFAELAGTAGDRLYAIASRILRDGDRAADATQQALIAMWNGLPGLRDPDRFEAWACRLVVHASYREARREGRIAARVREIRVPAGTEDEVRNVDDWRVAAVHPGGGGRERELRPVIRARERAAMGGAAPARSGLRTTRRGFAKEET